MNKQYVNTFLKHGIAAIAWFIGGQLQATNTSSFNINNHDDIKEDYPNERDNNDQMYYDDLLYNVDNDPVGQLEERKEEIQKRLLQLTVVHRSHKGLSNDQKRDIYGEELLDDQNKSKTINEKIATRITNYKNNIKTQINNLQSVLKIAKGKVEKTCDELTKDNKSIAADTTKVINKLNTHYRSISNVLKDLAKKDKKNKNKIKEANKIISNYDKCKIAISSEKSNENEDVETIMVSLDEAANKMIEKGLGLDNTMDCLLLPYFTRIAVAGDYIKRDPFDKKNMKEDEKGVLRMQTSDVADIINQSNQLKNNENKLDLYLKELHTKDVQIKLLLNEAEYSDKQQNDKNIKMTRENLESDMRNTQLVELLNQKTKEMELQDQLLNTSTNAGRANIGAASLGIFWLVNKFKNMVSSENEEEENEELEEAILLK